MLERNQYSSDRIILCIVSYTFKQHCWNTQRSLIAEAVSRLTVMSNQLFMSIAMSNEPGQRYIRESISIYSLCIHLLLSLNVRRGRYVDYEKAVPLSQSRRKDINQSQSIPTGCISLYPSLYGYTLYPELIPDRRVELGFQVEQKCRETKFTAQIARTSQDKISESRKNLVMKLFLELKFLILFFS